MDEKEKWYILSIALVIVAGFLTMILGVSGSQNQDNSAGQAYVSADSVSTKEVKSCSCTCNSETFNYICVYPKSCGGCDVQNGICVGKCEASMR